MIAGAQNDAAARRADRVLQATTQALIRSRDIDQAIEIVEMGRLALDLEPAEQPDRWIAPGDAARRLRMHRGSLSRLAAKALATGCAKLQRGGELLAADVRRTPTRRLQLRASAVRALVELRARRGG